MERKYVSRGNYLTMSTMKMTTWRRRENMVALVGLLVGVCCIELLPVFADAASPEKCSNFRHTNYIKLCHQPHLSTADQCPDGAGFVLDDLFLAPRSHYEECAYFHNNDLQKATCLRDVTEDYDERIFEVLERVSGHNRISNSTTVEPFVFTAQTGGQDGEGEGGGGEEGEREGEDGKDESAFLSFSRQCRPADPEKSDEVMINMCSTNTTVQGLRVYITLEGGSEAPEESSYCRCVINPSNDIDVKALDIRLQNRDESHKCGGTSLKIETESKESPDSGVRELRCEGKKALYGFHQLYKGDKEKEVVLLLMAVDSKHFPTAVWIEVLEEFDKDRPPMNVTCEGFRPMSELVVPTHRDDQDGDQEDDSADNEPATGLIIAVAVAVLVLIIIIVIICLWKRRQSRSGGGGLPFTCPACCKRGPTGKKPYRPVQQNEPIYSEPGNPRPAPYTDPADAKLPLGRPEYAEPDPTSPLSHAPTPPPLPISPPPSSPPPGVIPGVKFFPQDDQPPTAEEAPPKPIRTFERAKKRSKKEAVEDEEEYDHITSNNRRPSLNSPQDGQNNNEEEGGVKEPNIYSHLDHGKDYNLMELKARLKPVVKDNVYDKTS